MNERHLVKTMTQEYVSMKTDEIAVAARLGSELFYPIEMEQTDCARRFAMTLYAAQLGPVFLADLTFGADLRIDCGELLTSYHVNIPLRGSLQSQNDGKETLATPGQGTFYGPAGKTVLTRWENGSRQLCVKIDKTAFEDAVAAVTGHPVASPAHFDPVLDLRSGEGRSWADLVVWLCTQMRLQDSLFHQPLVTAPLSQSIITGLLSVAGLRGATCEEKRRSPSSMMIAQAVEFINEHPDEPLTTAKIATMFCISVRTLQEGFQRHVGESPQAYLRGVRLRRAHQELLTGNPAKITVATVAHRWGFGHLGRFAAAHKTAYGEAPSCTLRRGS